MRLGGGGWLGSVDRVAAERRGAVLREAGVEVLR